MLCGIRRRASQEDGEHGRRGAVRDGDFVNNFCGESIDKAIVMCKLALLALLVLAGVQRSAEGFQAYGNQE